MTKYHNTLQKTLIPMYLFSLFMITIFYSPFVSIIKDDQIKFQSFKDSIISHLKINVKPTCRNVTNCLILDNNIRWDKHRFASTSDMQNLSRKVNEVSTLHATQKYYKSTGTVRYTDYLQYYEASSAYLRQTFDELIFVKMINKSLNSRGYQYKLGTNDESNFPYLFFTNIEQIEDYRNYGTTLLLLKIGKNANIYNNLIINEKGDEALVDSLDVIGIIPNYY